MNKTLLDLSDEILLLDERLNEISDDDIEAQEAVLKDYAVSSLQADIQNKLNNYAKYIREIENRSEIRKNEAKRLLARSKIDDNHATRLKDMLKWFFRFHDLKTYETELYRISLCNNGGVLPLEITIPVDRLPSEYLRQDFTWVVDTDLLRIDLEAGVEIEGVRILERGQSIRIK